VSQATHHALLVHQASGVHGGGVTLETWNTATDTLIGKLGIPAGYTFVSGQVDRARDRGVVLLSGATQGAAALLSIDLPTGTSGPLIQLPVAPGLYPWRTFDIDSSTGAVSVLGDFPGFCSGLLEVPRVDLTTGTVTTAGTASRCTLKLASDGVGNLYSLTAHSVNRSIAPVSTLTTVVGDGQTSTQITVRVGGANSVTIDDVNELALTGFDGPVGIPDGTQHGWDADNNATPEIQVTDLTTGRPVRTVSGFHSVVYPPLLLKYVPGAVQLDPATRTGWTFGLGDGEIQQFSY
jgi:hypothetical protein